MLLKLYALNAEASLDFKPIISEIIALKSKDASAFSAYSISNIYNLPFVLKMEAADSSERSVPNYTQLHPTKQCN